MKSIFNEALLKGIGFTVICVLLSSCGIEALQNDVSRVQSSINDLRSFQAEQTTKISTLESELRQMSGRVEELEYAQNKRLGTDLNDLKRDVTELRRRVPPPAIGPASLLELDEARVGNMPQEVGSIFEQAFEALRAGKFEVSKERMMNAVVVAKGTELVADAYFWLAVSEDGLQNPKEALESYHELVSAFPKNRKAPLGLLRQASVFVKLGDNKVAKLTLNKLIADFPKSEEAKRAKERLKDL